VKALTDLVRLSRMGSSGPMSPCLLWKKGGRGRERVWERTVGVGEGGEREREWVCGWAGWV
jgi:hypothetical protein